MSTQVKNACISPNPISGQSILKFQANKNGVLEITAVDVLGKKKVIHSQKTESGAHTIVLNRNDVDSKGVCFYVISINGIQLETLKVVVQ